MRQKQEESVRSTFSSQKLIISSREQLFDLKPQKPTPRLHLKLDKTGEQEGPVWIDCNPL